MADVYEGRVKIGTLEIDATVREQYSISAEVTDHPVERGANISDHSRRKPDVLRMECVVTNTPIAAPDQLPVGYEARAWRAYRYLEDLVEFGEAVTVVTILGVWENMLVTEVQVPRDRGTGDALAFSCSLKQVVIVESRTALVVTKAPNGQPRRDKGKTGTEDAGAEATARTSTAKQFLNSLGVTKPGSGVGTALSGPELLQALTGGGG